MKIDSISLHHINMPLVAPFETSFGREVDRECIIISIRSGGLIGYGECVADQLPGYNYETVGTAWHIIKDYIAQLMLGQDVKDAADFQNRVSGIRGHLLAKAGIEMALWDLLGKRDKKSLREMLGGKRDKVEVGVSVGLQELPEVLVRNVTDYVKSGYAQRQNQNQAGTRCRRCVRRSKGISESSPASGCELSLFAGVGAVAQTLR